MEVPDPEKRELRAALLLLWLPEELPNKEDRARLLKLVALLLLCSLAILHHLFLSLKSKSNKRLSVGTEDFGRQAVKILRPH